MLNGTACALVKRCHTKKSSCSHGRTTNEFKPCVPTASTNYRRYVRVQIRCNARDENRKDGNFVPSKSSPLLFITQQPTLETRVPFKTPSTNDFLIGNAYLLIVSVFWGSYTPALKAVFNLPGAPSPLVVATLRGVLQTLILGTIFAIGYYLNDYTKISKEIDENEGLNLPPTSSKSTLLFGKLSPLVAGALEIGAYNTVGTLLQTWGLSLSSATRAAFLVQATSLWTPMLAAALGMAPSPLLWVSSLIALVSTVLVTIDQVDASHSLDGIFSSSSVTGDVATLMAALAYSMSTVRMPFYARQVPPLQLALGKSFTLACISCMLLIFQLSNGSLLASSSPSGSTAAAHADSLGALVTQIQPHQPMAWALIVWAATGPGAISAYLHVKGQSKVGPTDAQVVFSAVPLWSAILSAVFLPGEAMGPLAWAGGGGILMAGLVAALDQATSSRKRTDVQQGKDAEY